MTNPILFGLAVVIWGSTWYAIEFQLGVVAVEVSLTYRYAMATALAFGWCLVRGQSLRFGWVAHRYFLLMGLFLFGLNYLAAYFAQLYITSALNAICFSAMVWMNIINARIFFGTRIPRRTYAGAGLGLIGLIILFFPAVRKTLNPEDWAELDNAWEAVEDPLFGEQTQKKYEGLYQEIMNWEGRSQPQVRASLRR